MSYKFSTGSVFQGDIYFEDDRRGARTWIDFGHDTISLRPSGSYALNVSASAVGIGTTAPKTGLDVHFDPTSLANDTGGGEVVRFGAGPSGGSTTAGKLY